MPHLRDPTIVLPTLAYQLAYFDDEFKSELADVLAEYPHIPTDNLDYQFEAVHSTAVGSLQVVEIKDGACGPRRHRRIRLCLRLERQEVVAHSVGAWVDARETSSSSYRVGRRLTSDLHSTSAGNMLVSFWRTITAAALGYIFDDRVCNP